MSSPDLSSRTLGVMCLVVTWLVYDAICENRYLSKHRITKPFKAGTILLI